MALIHSITLQGKERHRIEPHNGRVQVARSVARNPRRTKLGEKGAMPRSPAYVMSSVYLDLFERRVYVVALRPFAKRINANSINNQYKPSNDWSANNSKDGDVLDEQHAGGQSC